MNMIRRAFFGLICAALFVTPAQSQLAPVVLRPGDAIQINLFPDAEGYTGLYPIEDNGNVVLPEIGEVLAAGVPMAELRAVIQRGYSATVRDRVVVLRPQFAVIVMGAVRDPSVYAVTSTENVFDVIARAGGFAGGADTEKVRIVRDEQVIPINALQSLEAGVNLTTYKLRSGDVIMVPPKGGISMRTVFEVVRTVSTLALLYDRLSDSSN